MHNGQKNTSDSNPMAEVFGNSIFSYTREKTIKDCVLVDALLGKINICAVQPSQFENRNERAHLEGKLANILGTEHFVRAAQLNIKPDYTQSIKLAVRYAV